jgi:hypothetical protein
MIQSMAERMMVTVTPAVLKWARECVDQERAA